MNEYVLIDEGRYVNRKLLKYWKWKRKNDKNGNERWKRNIPLAVAQIHNLHELNIEKY